MEKRKPAPQELAHRRLLASLKIKPLPGPPRHRESPPGQTGLFDSLAEDEKSDTTAPEDAV